MGIHLHSTFYILHACHLLKTKKKYFNEVSIIIVSQEKLFSFKRGRCQWFTIQRVLYFLLTLLHGVLFFGNLYCCMHSFGNFVTVLFCCSEIFFFNHFEYFRFVSILNYYNIVALFASFYAYPRKINTVSFRSINKLNIFFIRIHIGGTLLDSPR